MFTLTFQQLSDAIPKDKRISSHPTYASYIKSCAEPIGYTPDSPAFLNYITKPEDTAKKLKLAGAPYKDATNFFKSLKYFATKATEFIPASKATITPAVMAKLENYKTNFLDPIYNKKESPLELKKGERIQLIKEGSGEEEDDIDDPDLQDVDVTDVEDEEEEDEGNSDPLDIAHMTKIANKPEQAAPLRQVQKTLNELVHENTLLKQRLSFHEEILRQLLRTNPHPDTISLLFQLSCQQFH